MEDPGALLPVGALGDPEGEELTLRDSDRREDTDGEKEGLGEGVSVALPVGNRETLGEGLAEPLLTPLCVADPEVLAVGEEKAEARVL